MLLLVPLDGLGPHCCIAAGKIQRLPPLVTIPMLAGLTGHAAEPPNWCPWSY